MNSSTPHGGDYLQALADLISSRATACADQIETAARLIGESIAGGGILHLFGSGHSRLVAVDAAVRAASLTSAHAVYPEEWLGRIERVEGLGHIVVKRAEIQPGDVFVVISQSGLNPLIVDVATLASQAGAKVIGTGSAAHSLASESRHSSGRRLMDVCDVFLDTGVPAGDALFHPDDTPPVGPASTAAASALMHATLVQATRWLVDHGHEPPLRRSRNLPGGDEHNEAVAARYTDRIPELRWM